MDQTDWSGLGVLGVFGALFVAALCALVVGVPLAIYRVAARKNRASWDAPVRVGATRAYREAPLEVNAPGKIPLLVAAVSVLSLLAASVGGTIQLLALVQVPAHEVTLRDLEWLSAAFASGVVGVVLTRRSYVVAALAAGLAVAEIVLLPIAFAAHAALLAAAAVVHVRATLRACA